VRAHRLAVVLVLALALATGAATATARAATPSATTALPAVSGLPAPDTPAAGSFRPVAPSRLVDTRVTHNRLSRYGRLTVPVLGEAGVPTTAVGAVQLHVTSTGASGGGYLTAYPGGTARPGTSSLNYAKRTVVANTVTIRPGADGTVVVANAGTTVDVVVDLLGWYAASPEATTDGLHSIAPVRRYDSRIARHRLGRSGESVTVTGGSVPSVATAVIANLTTVNSSANGIPVLAWAAGTPRPGISNGNTVRGRAVATQVLAAVGAGGRISLAVGSGSTDIVVDVLGYVVAAAPSGGRPAAGTPVRLRDTRTTSTPLTSGHHIVQAVSGAGGVPAGAAAAIVTITSVPGPKASGTLVAFAHGESLPSTSDVNASKDVPVAQQVLVALGVDGALVLARTGGGSGHVVIDLVGYITPIPLPAVTATVLGTGGADPLTGQVGTLATQVLQTTVRYGLQTWWPTTAPALLAAPMDAAAPLDRSDAVRRLSMEALAVATALATGAYDPSSAGMSRTEATEVVDTLVGRVACAHRATVVGGWGRTWQSPLWSSLNARAAWLMWSSMSPATRACVRAMVPVEADYVATLKPKYMVAANGTVLSPGDTGGEEDSWFALAPSLAVAMMPTAEHRDSWRAAEIRLLAAAWSRPGDADSSELVDGVPLSSLVHGSNVLPDGTVVNHNRVAPDYSTNVYQSIDAVQFATLAGQPAPQATTHGLSSVYAALATNVYSPDSFAKPGGTIYPAGKSQVYYPQGCDWGTGQEIPYALLDDEAAVFGFGGATGTATDPAPPRLLHLAASAAMQERSPRGQMYRSASEYRYVGAEEHAAQLAAQLYLSRVIHAQLPVVVAAQPVRTAVAAPTVPAPKPVDESRLKR
jgi:hypothetical protein